MTSDPDMFATPSTIGATAVEDLLDLADSEPEALLELEAGITKLRRSRAARAELATRNVDEIRIAIQVRNASKRGTVNL